MIPTLVINLLLYTGEFQQNLLLMLTGPKILIGRRLFVKRTGLKLKLIFTISTTEWMFATSSIHSLAKLSFYKIDWAPYSQTRSNWDPSNSNYGGKQRDCSQTRPKSITEPLTSMKMSYFLQALMKKSFPRAIFWIWWMMSVWDFFAIFDKCNDWKYFGSLTNGSTQRQFHILQIFVNLDFAKMLHRSQIS